MKDQAVVPVPVHILGKEYRIACPPGEREALFAAAQYLNAKMREIRERGKVVGTERIAVMAALNIAHELLQARGAGERREEQLELRLRALRSKIDAALHEEERRGEGEAWEDGRRPS
ncbi:MAG: cell division protein ZapA [Gammaproteobacteria bacterium]|nr:MAG: cell division protein ZapA [Gammaproteobacteria bacterium]